MKLDEYEDQVEKLERGEAPVRWVAWMDGRYPGRTPRAEAVAEGARSLAREIRGCLWRPPFVRTAACLAERCDAIACGVAA